MNRESISIKIEIVQAKLLRLYGQPELKKYSVLLDALVETILSQNTSDINSRRAFHSLKQHFPDWGDVLAARTSSLEAAIWVGGLSRIKASRIKRLLGRVKKERGELSLEYLRKMEAERAYQSLLAYEGVGPKTAACTLLFGAGMPIFPVDTHVFRVCFRLGWVKSRETPEKFQERFRHLVPPEYAYSLHMNLVAHGRRFCHPHKPRCRECIVGEHCRYHKKMKI